ncbi:Rap1a/Tai family immunity protein [Xanthomonas tesorieronis]|uniref:Rap1a/Tai family immunity protein n=1 Tax=Xanthomonas tesorieronis TaxID=3160839 RepID=UPI003518B50B
MLHLLKGDPDAVAGLEPQRAECRRRQDSAAAKFYIAGVADGTERVQWCAGAGVLQHELADRVYTALSALPPAQLRQRASLAVIQALRAPFPCSR